LGPLSAGHVLQDLERGGERHAALDQQRLLALVVGRMQHQSALRLDRSAEQDREFRRRLGDLDAELLVNLAERQSSTLLLTMMPSAPSSSCLHMKTTLFLESAHPAWTARRPGSGRPKRRPRRQRGGGLGMAL